MIGPSAWIGFAIVAAVMLDFLSTTLSLRSDGFVAKRVGGVVRFAWGNMPLTQETLSGPLAISAVALTWVVGLWVGWTLVYADVLDGFTGPEGDVLTVWDALGFSGSTLSTLGLGVLTPNLAWIHVLTVVSSVSGMIVLTLSMTYVLNVSQIATASRGMALWLGDIDEMADGRSDDMAARIVLEAGDGLLPQVRQLTEQRFSFPLAGVYEWRGAERDVVRAAVALQTTVHKVRIHAPDEVGALRLQRLERALGDLSRS